MVRTTLFVCIGLQFLPVTGAVAEDLEPFAYIPRAAESFRDSFPNVFPCDGTPTPHTFHCGKGLCIDSALNCNRVPDCPDRQDEVECLSYGDHGACFKEGEVWGPNLNMRSTEGVELPDAQACQALCQRTVGCVHFAFHLPLGVCHRQDKSASLVEVAPEYISGPHECLGGGPSKASEKRSKAPTAGASASSTMATRGHVPTAAPSARPTPSSGTSSHPRGGPPPAGKSVKGCSLYRCVSEAAGHHCGGPKGWCVAKHCVCDGSSNCPDGSDEAACGPPQRLFLESDDQERPPAGRRLVIVAAAALGAAAGASVVGAGALLILRVRASWSSSHSPLPLAAGDEWEVGPLLQAE